MIFILIFVLRFLDLKEGCIDVRISYLRVQAGKRDP